MNILALLTVATLSATGISSISGQVLDAQQHPLPNAQVFLEQGITGPISRTVTDSNGEYQFTDLLPELTGVFAVSNGTAFNGYSVTLAPDDDLEASPIILDRSDIISGTIKTQKKKSIEGAVITRMLLQDSRVSIPFTKLEAYGFPPPRSDIKGAFKISRVPGHTLIALKIAHPTYAQEAVMGIQAGQTNVAVTLHSGVLVTGKVFARGTDTPVSNATIRFTNVHPPKDTALTRSGADGTYGVKLKPGEYVYEAVGLTYRSPVKLHLPVSGEYPGMDVSLYVAGLGTMEGRVMDAVSSEPIEDARIMLEINGVPSALERTGDTGNYKLEGIAGENVVKLMSAPGYLPPANTTISVQLKAREDMVIPTFWLVPIPKYTVEVIDNAQQSIPHAVISVLRPFQWGWRITDNNGLAELSFANLPNDGRVIGLVEHPDENLGALFSISKERASDAIVQLVPLSSVTGAVQNEAGAGVEGITVNVYFGDDTLDAPVLLRQTISQAEGLFSLEGIPTDIPLVYSTDNAFPALVHTAASGHSKIDTPLLASTDQTGTSLAGKTFPWRSIKQLGGSRVSNSTIKGKPAIVVFAEVPLANETLESLEEIKRILNQPALTVALVVNGTFTTESTSVSIFQGERPGKSHTYVLDTAGTVIYETDLLPPLSLIHRLTP